MQKSNASFSPLSLCGGGDPHFMFLSVNYYSSPQKLGPRNVCSDAVNNIKTKQKNNKGSLRFKSYRKERMFFNVFNLL